MSGCLSTSPTTPVRWIHLALAFGDPYMKIYVNGDQEYSAERLVPKTATRDSHYLGCNGDGYESLHGKIYACRSGIARSALRT